MLSFAEALRERHQTLIETVRRGEMPPVDDLERQQDDLNEMIGWFSLHDGKIEEMAEMLSHRINNLLMAVQTTSDYLATTHCKSDLQVAVQTTSENPAVPENAGLDRLRERMDATITSGKSALEEVRAILFNLR